MVYLPTAIINYTNYLYISMTGMCPYYKISKNEETGYVWPGYSGNLSSKCEFYFTSARAKKKKIHLRFTDLILSPGDKITVKDTKDGRTLASYSERNSPPARTLISEGRSVRLVFTPGHTGTSKSRFTLFHQASGRMCRLRKKDQARNSFLHYTLTKLFHCTKPSHFFLNYHALSPSSCRVP